MKWGWYLSALLYELSYSKLMHDIDGYTIGFLAQAEKLKNSRILDVGAGTGNIDFKLLEAGASEIVAIENNPAMVHKIKSKTALNPDYSERIKVIEKDMYSGVIENIGNCKKFDVELFRRCLYSSEEKVVEVLKEGFKQLNDNGIMFIVHPEANKRKYFDNGFGGVALSHVLKWYISNIGSKTAIEYNRYNVDKLEKMCKEACPGSKVQAYTPIRPAYNILSITKC